MSRRSVSVVGGRVFNVCVGGTGFSRMRTALAFVVSAHSSPSSSLIVESLGGGGGGRTAAMIEAADGRSWRRLTTTIRAATILRTPMIAVRRRMLAMMMRLSIFAMLRRVGDVSIGTAPSTAPSAAIRLNSRRWTRSVSLRRRNVFPRRVRRRRR